MGVSQIMHSSLSQLMHCYPQHSYWGSPQVLLRKEWGGGTEEEDSTDLVSPHQGNLLELGWSLAMQSFSITKILQLHGPWGHQQTHGPGGRVHEGHTVVLHLGQPSGGELIVQIKTIKLALTQTCTHAGSEVCEDVAGE